MRLVVFILFGLVVQLLIEVRHLAIFDSDVIVFDILDGPVYFHKPVHCLVAPLLQRMDLYLIFKLVL